MARFRRELGVCYGRDFTVGLCSKIVDFATRPIAAGGAGWHLHRDGRSETHPFVYLCDTPSPGLNDYNTGPTGLPPKYLQIGYLTTEPGFIRFVSGCAMTFASPPLRNVFGGYRIATLDAADFVYVLGGGEECFFVMANHTGGNWYWSFMDEWEGISTLVEGTDKVGVLQSTVTPGTDVVLQLGAGQAANFTVGKWYYITDFSTTTAVNYVRVDARNLATDEITVNSIQNYDFDAGAVIASYAHRFYSIGLESGLDASSTITSYMNADASTGFSFNSAQIPYMSDEGSWDRVSHPGFGSTVSMPRSNRSTLRWPNILSDVLDPDDEGKYVGVRPVIGELRGFTRANIVSTQNMNRVYGRTKNLIRTARADMTRMGNYRTMNGIDYINVQSSSAVEVYCFRWSEET